MRNLKLIDKFREKINSNNFVMYKYQNIANRNQWGCICSAMDWITVAMQYIVDVDAGKRRCIQSMEMYAYISSIDVIWEAIQQLHRVLFQTNNIPFKDERECFFNKIIDQDDNNYFKTLRASFGAHPVNLKGKDNGEKYFASWSGSIAGDYDVLLYSNKVDGGFRTLYLKIDELNKFLDKRYNYLNKLMDEIDRQYTEFKYKMSKKSIKRNDEICAQLYILQTESKERLHLYETIINKLIIIFNTAITDKENKKMVLEYRKSLYCLVNDIYRALQDIDSYEVNDAVLYQTSDKLPAGYGYFVEKLTEYIYGVGYPPSVWEEKLIEKFKGHFVINYSSYEELYVLILSCINKLNKNN